MKLYDSVLEEQRPWAFSRSQLTAGLRSHTGDNKLTIREIKEIDLPDRRPSVGRIRGIHVVCQGSTGRLRFNLVVKEPQGTTRAGMAGAGRREVSFYRCLGEQIPIEIPRLVTAQPDGGWMIFEHVLANNDLDRWETDQYLIAVDNLVTLHDRFWSLEKDLEIYNWLGRPLTRDFEVYEQAASTGINHLLNRGELPIFTQKPVYLNMLEKLVKQAGVIALGLKNLPFTLIHGDYWPGNLLTSSNGKMVAYDWQHVSIGPGILDLVKFFQISRWHFSPMPISQSQIAAKYRNLLMNKNGHTWVDKEWDRDWDFALLWIFLTDWIDLLAQVPSSILETRQADIESIWFEPVHQAISKRIRE
jgi:hypothetical protein